ncbi:Zinc finger protein jing [Portunus trituberculatus]|uniref:Zinc finger protein jing n=1 Tax=Portunus trituberculatus TaxID=210409 RepID=A0A5B7EIC6_PORTR|nr:Zinc finger protein jing [Portunus trituberculatus]
MLRNPALPSGRAGTVSATVSATKSGYKISQTQGGKLVLAVHVEGQLEAESFRCLWVGCKVYEKASCSVSWLERHVLTHGGHKPFKCIVEGCGHRFTSQMALGRHVNNHFSAAAATPAPRPPTQPSPTKLIRKNGRKCRYRKKPWSAARMFDMFDVGVMERLQWRLMCATQVQNGGTPLTSAQTFTLRPQVLARRMCGKDSAEVLVSWSPPGM